jgi:Spy/CpxP family protein refolding chaperone
LFAAAGFGLMRGGVLMATHSGTPAARVRADATQQPHSPPSEPRRGFDQGSRGVPGAPEPRAWWRDAQMAKEVGLTPPQIARINQLYESRQKQIQPKLDEYNQLKTDLDRMFREHAVTPEEMEAQARRMTYPQMDIVVSRLRLLYEMSRVMTPEQNNKLRAIFDRERREQGRGRGMGRNLPRP